MTAQEVVNILVDKMILIIDEVNVKVTIKRNNNGEYLLYLPDYNKGRGREVTSIVELFVDNIS